MTGRARRLRIVLSAVRGARRLHAHDGWDAQRLAGHRRRRLLEIVRYAAARSPYYRERFAGIDLDDDLQLASLPVLDKATMVERFDEIVTDRHLTRATLDRHLEGLDVQRGDPLLFGEYRVMASSGSSGHRGLFAYSRGEWLAILAGLVRWNNFYLKMGPRLPPRRVAMVAADSPLHMTGRLARSLDAGAGHKILRLDARTPLEEIVQALNAFQPESLTAYASVASLLAGQQLAGALRIAPKVVVTTSEVRTAEMQRRIIAAWKVSPFNSYSSTETGMLAGDCDRHTGLHVFEDQVQIEVVDDGHQPVAPGQPGSRLLITSLFNRTQPLIRYELNDLVTLSTERCACGRPFPLLEAVDGRCDDVLELSAIAGGTVKVHPLTLQSPLATIPSLAEYRIVCAPGELRVEAVLDSAEQQTCLEIETRLAAALAKRGVKPLPIRVQRVSAIPRNPVSGKRKAVEIQIA